MESIVNNRARPPVKKAWDLNTYYHRRSRPSGHDCPQVPPTQSTTRPVGQCATHVPAHRSGEEAHGYRHMNTTNLMLSTVARHRTKGRRAGPAQNQHAAAEVRKANHESSPRRIHSFSKARRRLSEGSAVPYHHERDMIVSLMGTWCHTSGNSVFFFESATIDLLIRTDDLS
jgi:hypothetical protein